MLSLERSSARGRKEKWLPAVSRGDSSLAAVQLHPPVAAYDLGSPEQLKVEAVMVDSGRGDEQKRRMN